MYDDWQIICKRFSIYQVEIQTISLLQFKYTTYVYFMFLFIQFVYQSLFLFCLLKLALSLNLIHFYLIYYQDNGTEHHKAISILHAVEIPRFFRRKQETEQTKISLFFKTKRLCPLLFTARHYSLLVNFVVEVTFLVG